jgi:hypothetical protein
MQLNIAKEVSALRRLTAKQLRERYAEVFGDATRANNKVWLIKRIAWRLQARAEGDLSQRARRRALELADDANLRLSPPRNGATLSPTDQNVTEVLPFKVDGRLPPAGSVITRRYKGEDLQVKVRADGFEFEGQVYRSLSAVAKAITGQHCNGFSFFRIGPEVAR